MTDFDVLTALTSKPRERKFLVYDLESKDGATQKPGFTRVFLAGAFDGVRYESFRNKNRYTSDWELDAINPNGCIDSLMHFVLSNRYASHYIYAHNGGNFDHLHVLPWLVRNQKDYEIKIIPVQSSIQVLKVTHRKNHQSWTFLDSMKLFPMALDKAAKTFGFAGKLSHDLAMHEDDKRWDAYLRRDCEALYESVSQYQYLVLDRLGGELGITSPSTAMKLYRRKYMAHGQAPAIIPQNRHFESCQDDDCYGCMHTFIRKGYYGGRTEIFRPTGKGLSYYDINSSYPKAMLEPMPAGEAITFKGDMLDEDFYQLETGRVGFVACEVFIPEKCYLPPLPYRHPTTGKLVFPTGKFSGVWPWDELKLIFHPEVNGSILRVAKSVWYEKKVCFFDFVKELYTFRDKSSSNYDEGLATVSKLMMNSLYGKFGMNEERREIMVLRPGEKPPEGATFPRFDDGMEDIFAGVCYIDKRVSPPYIIPQISAQITALARVRLWQYMQSILSLGGKIYYCDTDSIITDLPNVPGCSNELGDLKNEYPGEVIDVDLVGPKMYMMAKRGAPFKGEHKPSCKNKECLGCSNEKFVMKGVPKSHRTAKTLHIFRAKKEIKFQRLQKLGGMMAQGLSKPPHMINAVKSLKSEYDKRYLLVNGDSLPLVINEGGPGTYPKG